MELPVIFTCGLLILWCGASDSRHTCVDRTEDLRLDCGVGVVYVEGAAVLGDCSESVTCCQDTSHSDDVITARVTDWCEGLVRCHVAASTWHPGESGGRISLAVSYVCKLSPQYKSDTIISKAKHIDIFVMPTVDTTSECYGSSFSLQCRGARTIEITDAVFGVSRCHLGNANPTHCCPNYSDCTFSIQEADQDYYNEILGRCNNKQTCDGLVAQWYALPYLLCTGIFSDYVTLNYLCLKDADRITTTTATNTTTHFTPTPSPSSPVITVSTATTTVVVMAPNTTAEDDEDSTLTTVIVAVSVVVVVTVVVSVTVWMVCRKRKSNNTQENITAAAQSRPGMMTSHASACVDDVDPYHTARPGGDPGPRGPPPAQGLNDVTKPATNPYDTAQPLAKPVFAKKPKPNPKAVDKPNIGADLYTEVVRVRPRKNVVLDKSPGEEDVEANNNGSDMTEAGDRASYDLVMQENHGYGTRQGVGGDGEGEWHGVDAEGLPHEGPQYGDQDEQTGPDYDLVMTENNAYS